MSDKARWQGRGQMLGDLGRAKKVLHPVLRPLKEKLVRYAPFRGIKFRTAGS